MRRTPGRVVACPASGNCCSTAVIARTRPWTLAVHRGDRCATSARACSICRAARSVYRSFTSDAWPRSRPSVHLSPLRRARIRPPLRRGPPHPPASARSGADLCPRDDQRRGHRQHHGARQNTPDRRGQGHRRTGAQRQGGGVRRDLGAGQGRSLQEAPLGEAEMELQAEGRPGGNGS